MQARLFRAALCATALLTVACSDPQVAKQRFFEQAQAAFDKEQYAEAILAYRNSVRIDPLFGEARLGLAEAYERTGDEANAFREVVRAADLLPQRADAQMKAARYLIAAGQYEDARARASRAIEVEPSNAEAHILLGNATAATKDFDGAMREIQEAIDIEPSGGAGHISLGALLLAQGRRAEAQESFERAVSLDPASVESRLALATYHLSVGGLKDAESAIAGALSLEPRNARANRAMAVLHVVSGRPELAEPYLQAMTQVAGTPEAEVMLADYYLRMNRADAATPLLERASASSATFGPAGVRLAGIHYAAGRKAEAHARLDAVLQRMPALVEALVSKGQWLLAEGRAEEAVQPAEAAAAADPGSAPAQFLLGRVRLARHDAHGAEEAFAEVLRLNPRAGAAQTQLARLHLAAGRTEVGVQFARDAVANQPANNDARILLVRGLLATRDATRASAELAPLLREFPDHPTIRAVNGTLLAMKKDTVGARREFERALQVDPGQIDALTGLTTLDAEIGQLERARQRLGVQLDRSPSRPELLLLAARADLQAGDLSTGERRLRHVIDQDPANLRAYELLARTYLRQQRLDEARLEFEQIAERHPRAVGAHTFVGMIYDAQKRPSDAEQAYRRALAVDPSAPVAANNLAYIYAERSHNLEEALALARAAAERLQDEPAVLDTLGWVYYRKDLPELAIPHLQRSVDKDPRNPLYHFHLGLAHSQAGHADKARTALQEALRLNPSFDGSQYARQVLASLKG